MMLLGHPENLKIVVDNLIVSCIVCFWILPFAWKEVEGVIPTPISAQIVCATNKAGECVSSDSDVIAVSVHKIARKKGCFFALNNPINKQY